MKFKKAVTFLDAIPNDKNLSKFVTKKWIKVYDQSERNYSPNKEIRIKTAEGDNNANKWNKNLAFKNHAQFINCISKIDGVKIDNEEDLGNINVQFTWIQ